MHINNFGQQPFSDIIYKFICTLPNNNMYKGGDKLSSRMRFPLNCWHGVLGACLFQAIDMNSICLDGHM